MLYGLRRHPERLDRHPGVKAELTALGFSWNVPKKGPKGPRRKKYVAPQVSKPSSRGVLNVTDGSGGEGGVVRRGQSDGGEEEVVGSLSIDDDIRDRSEDEGLDLDLYKAESDAMFLCSSRRGKNHNRPFEPEGMVGEGMTATMRKRLEENLMARKQQHQRRLRKAVALGAASRGDGELEGHGGGVNGEEGTWRNTPSPPQEEEAYTSSPMGGGRRKGSNREKKRDNVAEPAAV